MFPTEIQKIISNYQIFGLIPLDKFLHLIAGMVVTIVMRWCGVRMRWIFVVLGLVVLFKEIMDSNVLGSTVLEHALDTIVTFIYPCLLWVAIKTKKQTENL